MAVSHTYIITAAAAPVIESVTFCGNGKKGRGAFQFLLCHSCLKITTGMKDQGLIQLRVPAKAKDYCIQHGPSLCKYFH